MSNAIDEAVRAAEAQAQAAVSVSVVAAQPSGAVTVTPPGRKITIDDIISRAMSVDAFIKFNELGLITVGKSDPVKEIHVKLNLSEIVPSWGVRYGNPPTYERTHDGVTSTKGGTWNDAVARAKRVDPRADPYDAWDLPFTLLADVPATSPATTLEAGSRVGYTTVWSSFKAFKPFYDTVRAKFGADAQVELKIGCKGINQPGKKYGEPIFTLIGEVSQD